VSVVDAPHPAVLRDASDQTLLSLNEGPGRVRRTSRCRLHVFSVEACGYAASEIDVDVGLLRFWQVLAPVSGIGPRIAADYY